MYYLPQHTCYKDEGEVNVKTDHVAALIRLNNFGATFLLSKPSSI